MQHNPTIQDQIMTEIDQHSQESRTAQVEAADRSADASEAERRVKEPPMTQTTQSTQPMNPIPLYVARIGRRQFTAAVAYKPAANGWLVSDVRGTRKTAVASLEAKLREAGAAIPPWTVVDKGDLSPKVQQTATPAAKPEAPAAPAAKPVVDPRDHDPLLHDDPVFPAEDVDDDAETLRKLDAIADKAEEALEQAKETVVMPAVAPQMDGAGWVTPLSDHDHWVDIYRQCRDKLSGIDYPGETRREQIRNYRESVNVLMESIGFAGPWRKALGGSTWLTFAREVDETVRQPRARGARAQLFVKDLNGNWVRVERDKRDPAKIATPAKPEVSDERVRELLGEDAPRKPANQTQTEDTVAKNLTRAEKRALNKAAHAAQRKAARAEGPKYTGGTKEQRSAAFAHGRYMAGRATAEGHDARTARVWFKLGVVSSLKAQGVTEPHYYEADLVAIGYESVIEEQAAALAANLAAKAA